MSTTPELNTISDEHFYAVIERLKVQGSLSRDSFIREIPFFSFASISKESQVKELFSDANDHNMYKTLLKNIISEPEESSELLSEQLSALNVMSFAQIVLYKVLPCPNPDCPNRPREIATHNQYKDFEYQCPFYHHERDRRRLVIKPEIDEEFVYKANYYEEGKRHADKDKYSQNYFESMFHPLYYKMFRCKREYCNQPLWCPFFHNEEEKKTWDNVFGQCINKGRITYVKDKQKYYEHGTEGKRARTGALPPQVGKGKNENHNKHYQQNRSGRSYQNFPMEEKIYERSKTFQTKKWDEWKKSSEFSRKTSDEYLDSKSYGFFEKENTYSVC